MTETETAAARPSMRILIFAAVSLGTVMALVLLLLLVRLNANLDALRGQVAANLDEAAERLQRETDRSAALTADLEETDGRLQRETDRSAALTADLQSASARLGAAAAELEARTIQLATQHSENETLTASLAASGALLEGVTAEKADLEADLEAAARLLANSADAYATLAQAGGSVADLSEAQVWVMAEIAARNCSELRREEQLAAGGEGIEALGPPGAEEGMQGHLGVGPLR